MSRAPQTPVVTIELEGELVTRLRREAAKRDMPAASLGEGF
jgi:hypothetical protein